MTDSRWRHPWRPDGCPWCDADVDPLAESDCCSAECMIKWQDWCKTHPVPTITERKKPLHLVLRTRDCRGCGIPISPSAKSNYCSPGCRRRWQQLRKDHPEWDTEQNLQCPECDGPLLSDRKVYCSDTCSAKARMRRLRQRRQLEQAKPDSRYNLQGVTVYEVIPGPLLQPVGNVRHSLTPGDYAHVERPDDPF